MSLNTRVLVRVKLVQVNASPGDAFGSEAESLSCTADFTVLVPGERNCYVHSKALNRKQSDRVSVSSPGRSEAVTETSHGAAMHGAVDAITDVSHYPRV